MLKHSDESESANVSGILRFRDSKARDDFLARVDSDREVRTVRFRVGRSRPDVVIRNATQEQRDHLLALAGERARWIDDFRVGIFKPPG